MKKYTVFCIDPALLERCHQIVWCHIQDTCWIGGVLPLSRNAADVLTINKREIILESNIIFQYRILQKARFIQSNP